MLNSVKGSRSLETIVGLLCIILVIFIVTNSYEYRDNGIEDSYYKLFAKFSSIDGIDKGSDVRIAGIKVGRIENRILDNDFNARIVIYVQKNIQLPKDSVAKITTEGFLGSRYVNIIPGAAKDLLKDGDMVQYTQSSLNLEDLVAKIVYK